MHESKEEALDYDRFPKDQNIEVHTDKTVTTIIDSDQRISTLLRFHYFI
jgi:hypothetical protein